jgi:hypothetical protein
MTARKHDCRTRVDRKGRCLTCGHRVRLRAGEVIARVPA